MTSGAPWSVKGIDPKAREVAKDLARRSGMTLGEWLNRVILEDESPEDATSQDQLAERPARAYLQAARGGGAPTRIEAPGHPGDVAIDAVERLTARLEEAETRMGLAISGVEHSVRETVARIETGQREQVAVAARFEGAVAEIAASQSSLAERLRRVETEKPSTRSVEALRSLEQALGKVAGHLYEGESKTRAMIEAVTERVGRLEERETADPSSLADAIAGKLGARLAEAEAKTAGALEGLRASFAALDGRLKAVEGDEGGGLRLEDLAAGLSQSVDAVREEVAEKLRAATEQRFDSMENKLGEMTRHVEAAEHRSARAIEQMGREVMTVAENLNRRVAASEQRGAEAIEQAGGEMSRIASAVETRLGRSETVHAEALERLSGEIARITERLGERIGAAERRSALAIDEVGEQVVRVTDRMNQRNERASQELADRIRQSEERTARLLDEARERIDQQLGETRRAAAAEPAPVTPPPAAATPRSVFSPFGATFTDLGPAEPDRIPTVAEAPPSPLGDFPDANAPAREPAFGFEDFVAAEAFEPKAEPEPEAAFEPDDIFEPAPEPRAEALDLEARDVVEAVWETPPEPQAQFEPEPEPIVAPARTLASEPQFPEDGFDEETEFLAPEPKAAQRGFGEGPEYFRPEPAAAQRGFGEDAEFFTPEPKAPERVFDEFEDDAAAVDAAFEPAPTTSDLDATLFGDAPAAATEAEPEPVARPLTTREIIEQARAAARAGSQSGGAAKADPVKKGLRAAAALSGKPSLGGMFSNLGRGRGKRRNTTMQTALLIAGGAAFLSVGAAGLVVMGAKPGGAPPKRVAEAIERERAGTEVAAETDSGPFGADSRAAIALSPQLIGPSRPMAASAPSQDVIDAYQNGVRSLEAGEPGGLEAVRKAANLGYAPAQRFLAKVNETGAHGAKLDSPSARRWMERAAQGGDRGAMHDVALYYIRGVGGAKDPSGAAQWFRRAADLGLVDSQYNLGVLYEKGIGVPQNAAEAYKWFLVAARSGDLEARQSGQRVRAAMSPEARAVAERAAAGYRSAAGGATAAGADANASAIAQQALSRLGFYQGPRDGRPSTALTLAVAAYQREQGLPATGALDQVTLARLAVFTR
jgi:localization factor PodJL